MGTHGNWHKASSFQHKTWLPGCERTAALCTHLLVKPASLPRCGFMEVRPRQSRGGSQRSTASCFRTSGLLATRPCQRSCVKEPSECKQRPSDQSTNYQVGWSRASATVLRKPAPLFLCSAKGSVLSQNGYVLVTPTRSGAVQCLAMLACKDMALYK